MKNFFTALVFVFSLGLGAQNYFEHTIKQGETIEGIAKQYLVTPFDIYALNPDAKIKFQPNTVLIIPNSKIKNTPISEDTKTIVGYKKHKVKRKETLYGLSKKYGVTEEDIKKANRFLYAENLKKGDKIRIPKFRTIVSQVSLKNTLKTYTVKPKEGKWRIAYKFGITVAELEDLNPSINAVLQPGDVLNVPNVKLEDEKPIDPEYSYYEVLPKEGFYRLKIKTGLTQDELETLNPELKEGGLKVGMVLKVPVQISTTNSDTRNLSSEIKNFDVKKIALMLPYQLNDIEIDSVAETKDRIKNNKLLALVLDVHVGVRMALDSAKQLGISTDLKVLDTRYNASVTGQLLRDNDLTDYHAIIGPIKEENFARVASTLSTYQVPVIAALNKPKQHYTNVFQTLPEKKLLEDAMIDYVKADSLASNVVIIADHAHRTVSNRLLNTFPNAKQIFSEKDKKTGKDAHFVYPVRLENVFQNGKTIVFLETNNNAMASSVISMLNSKVKYGVEIVLVTLDKNKAFEGKNIDNNNLSNLNFHYPSVRKNFDDTTPNGFVTKYKKEFGVSPSKYASRGFDVTLDVLLRLAAADNLFETADNGIETAYIENKFKYVKSTYGGYINKAVYIVKYDNLRIIEAQ